MSFINILLLLIIIGLLLIKEKKVSLFHAQNKDRLILDSCVLIDGRIEELLKLGIVRGEIIIPQFIISELQLLADGSNTHKRERARYGLDIVKKIQELDDPSIIIDRTLFVDTPLTDNKLIALAKAKHAFLYTTDYNLGKVATTENIRVVNINDIALSMKPIVLPGEKLVVAILQKGSNPNQGVGYLDDGTMIVVEKAGSYVGKTLQVIVEGMRQTSSGKMVFARPQTIKTETQKTDLKRTLRFKK